MTWGWMHQALEITAAELRNRREECRHSLRPPMYWFEFSVSSIIIVFAGIKLTHYADRLSDQLRLGKGLDRYCSSGACHIPPGSGDMYCFHQIVACG